MKITSMKVFMNEYNRSADPKMPKRSKVVGVRIYTDEGIYGDGEVAGIHTGWGAYGAIRDLWPFIKGQDPMANDALFDKMYLRSFWGQNGGSLWYSAASAIDVALWDIKAKALNVPLHILLGGKRRDKVRCYASQLQFGWGPYDTPALTIEDFANIAKVAVADGYDCIKIDFMDRDEKGERLDETNRIGLLPVKLVNLFSDRVHAVREAIGPDVDLIIENHCGTNAESAVQLGKTVEDCNIFFFEEPCTPIHYNNKYVAEKLNMPITHGERIFGRHEYIDFFNDHSISVIQPDLGNAGGITETKKICDMAYTFDIGVQVHVCGTQLLTPPAVQLEACISNFVIHEQHVRNLNPENQKFTNRVILPKNGYLEVEDLPGLGIEWSDYAMSSPDMMELK